MQTHTLFDGSLQTRCPVSVATRHSEIGIFRHHSTGGDMSVSAPAQDAHLVILQLQDLDAHQFWADGKHIEMPSARAGSLGIVDLRRKSAAEFVAPIDSLHLHLPHAALDDLMEGSRAAGGSNLSTTNVWEDGDATMRQLQPALVGAIQCAASASPLFVEHLVLAAAAHIATTYGAVDLSPPTKRSMLAPWQVRRAKEMLAADFGRTVTVQQVADACGLSSSHFARAFRETTGLTPLAWVQSCRIGRARDLLVEGRMSLSEIALQCGFADQSHFTRIFKRATGVGPGAWRRTFPMALPRISGNPERADAR
jgi:AraC family transcriptional regulator